MPTPASDEAPRARTTWKLRAATFVAIGVVVVGLVLGAARTVDFALTGLGSLHSFHASAYLLPPVVATETSTLPDASDHSALVPDVIPSAEPVAPPIPDADAAVDAGDDTAPPDTRRARARRTHDASADARHTHALPASPCNVELALRVEAFYAPTVSFTAMFDQQLFVGALGSTTRSHGSVVVAKPGKMSWSYDDPESSRIVSDGQTVSVYEAPTKHLFRVPAGTSPYPGAFAFLTGQAALTTLFDFVARNVEGTTPFPDACLLVGRPRALTRAYTKVLFYVDRRTFQVRRVAILDREGDQNRIDLIDPSVDVPIDADQFVFAPPTGTIVVGR